MSFSRRRGEPGGDRLLGFLRGHRVSTMVKSQCNVREHGTDMWEVTWSGLHVDSSEKRWLRDPIIEIRSFVDPRGRREDEKHR